MQALVNLAADLMRVAANLSDEIDNRGDSDRGNARNLADALECLGFMDADEADVHAREHLPALVDSVLPALEREAPELAARLAEGMASV